jgi:hypothetical protein
MKQLWESSSYDKNWLPLRVTDFTRLMIIKLNNSSDLRRRTTSTGPSTGGSLANHETDMCAGIVTCQGMALHAMMLQTRLNKFEFKKKVLDIRIAI